MNLLACLALCVAAAPGQQGNGQGTLSPKFFGNLKLSPVQMSNWSKLVSGMQMPAPGTGLLANGTLLVGGFPDGVFNKTVFSSPAKGVEFVVGVEGYPAHPSAFVIQYASDPSTLNLTAPYTGWAKPKGLLTTQEVSVSLLSKPKNPSDAALRNAPYAFTYAGETGRVSLGPSTRYGYFNLTLPPSGYATGTYFWVRAVPVKISGNERTAIGPASNWVQVYVSVTEDQFQKKLADTKAAHAKKNAEAQGLALVTEANEARKAVWNAYEIRLLSYIPPKFSDDSVAVDYFLANRGVSLTYDKGSKATKLNTGESYSLTEVKNLLNSNKTWSQDLWDVLAATLNQTSGAYKAAKAAAVKTLADGIDAIPGVTVTPSMREGMATILDMALAYCGVPPSLPNIDELYSKGIDYMAMAIADMAIEQATGIAVDELGANAAATKALAEKAREPAKKALAGFIENLTKPVPFVADVPETWGSPAPFFRRRPAMLYLEIRRKPGSLLPVGQSWQSLELTINNTFASIPQVLLPRTIDSRVRIPIALAPTQSPASWNVVGMMPDKEIDPASGTGQPYYGDRSNTVIGISTSHHLGKSGSSFKALWPAITINSGYVNARPLPDKPIMLPGESEAALEKPIEWGPKNYFGKVKVRWFRR